MSIRNFVLALSLTVTVATLANAQDAKKSDDKSVKQAQDPVCGMMIDITPSAPKSDYKGKTYYFCSLEDKKEFDRTPASYLKTEKKDTTKKQ